MPPDAKQLQKISSEQSFDADNLETDSHCGGGGGGVILWGLEKAEVSPPPPMCDEWNQKRREK